VKTNAHAIALIVLTVMFSGAAFALSNLGGSCEYSRDCKEGYCFNSTCRFPSVLEKFETLGNCSYTAECFDGFCKDGKCISPIVEEHSIFTPAMGIASGCAGFIDNCSGIWCLFCDATWVLLAVSAAASAFISRKRGRMLPILLFTLPMAAGFLFFPVLGFMLAVMEIFIFAFLKKPIKTMESTGTATMPPKPLKPAVGSPEQTKPQEPMNPLPFDKET